VDQGESFAVVSNYSGGSAAVFPLLAGGLLGKAAQIMRFTGRGPNVSRQEASHAHSFIFDPSNNYGFVCDLGADRIWACRIKPGEISSPLTDAGVPCFFSRPGSGPRHGVFHPSGKFCYVVNELESTVDVLGYEPLRGSFIPKQSLSSLPPGEGLSGETPPEPERADNTAAAIRISAGGEFVYVSNRGHNSITLFKTEPAGTLGYIDCVPAGGKTPRDFLIDPSGKFLLGCNQDSDSLVVFRIEQNTGQLKKQGIYTVPSPVCLLIPQ
jgi:6-phosphogluconolactonase